MGERVQIARQDTLLEVQTTGTQTQNTLDLVNGKIGNFGDTAEEGTLFGQMAGGSGSTGAVKSVQRGYIRLTNTGNPTEMQITISKIDPQKSFVILNTDTAEIDRHYGQGLCLKSLTENKLVVRSETRGGIWFSWQVIECF